MCVRLYFSLYKAFFSLLKATPQDKEIVSVYWKKTNHEAAISLLESPKQHVKLADPHSFFEHLSEAIHEIS